MTIHVLIVPTGLANTASVIAAFARLGAHARTCADAAALGDAERVLLPGVGAFGAAMQRIDELGLREVLCQRVAHGRATLAICLGMQMLCSSSEESPGVRGLGVLAANVRRFGSTVRVPQLGWNRVEPSGCHLLAPGVAYFANSYRLDTVPAGWNVAMTDHGGTFPSACERGAVLACQFHPEISGDYGSRLLARWLALPAEVH